MVFIKRTELSAYGDCGYRYLLRVQAVSYTHLDVYKRQAFDFLGFTFYCGKTRKGTFALKLQTSRKKFERKLKDVYKRQTFGSHRSLRQNSYLSLLSLDIAALFPL